MTPSVVDPGPARALAAAEPGVFWLADPDRPEPLPALRGRHEADLAVVGGGYSGLWTALRAKERYPDLDVVVLEAGRCGDQASGRNGGFASSSLTHGFGNGQARWPEELSALDRIGAANLEAIGETVDRYGIDCAWERTGELMVATAAHQVEELDDLAGEMRGAGHDVELLVVHAAATAGDGRGYVGEGQRGLGEHPGDVLPPRTAQLGRVDGDAGSDQRRVEVLVAEQLVDVGPLRVDRRLHPGVGQLGAVAEPEHPHRRVVTVVVDFLDRLRGDRGEGLVGAALKPGVELVVVAGEEQQPRHRHAEVAVGAFDQVHAAEVALVAEVGQVVLGARRVLERAGVGQQRPGLAEQVERDVADRDVLLELRRGGDPLRQPLGRDQRVVAQRQHVAHQRRVVRPCDRHSARSA